ncbi:hypothetical protein QCA50_002027 [Cerrena zonata]|uniref:RlpA-like protein double-psi beta-barrel domain-containing protein n=1 Tax=Cerrena zonata TaxID=2478898 RepID=A0AAW0GYK5_9APHY
MFVGKAILVASLALSVSALATPHAAHGKRHHDIAARVASPEAHPEPIVHVAPRKRSAKRCKAPASSSVAPSSSSSAPAVTSSAVINVGADPATTSEAPVAVTTEAPAPTTSKAPATTKAATTKAAETPTTTTQAPAPTTTASSGGSGSGDTYSGDGTFYDTGLGACGITNSDSDFIAAIGHGGFDSFPGYNGANPNNNPICNKEALVHYQGKSVKVKITDRCGGCDNPYSLDFSPAAFQQLADPSVGRIHDITWSWV